MNLFDVLKSLSDLTIKGLKTAFKREVIVFREPEVHYIWMGGKFLGLRNISRNFPTLAVKQLIHTFNWLNIKILYKIQLICQITSSLPSLEATVIKFYHKNWINTISCFAVNSHKLSFNRILCCLDKYKVLNLKIFFNNN